MRTHSLRLCAPFLALLIGVAAVTPAAAATAQQAAGRRTTPAWIWLLLLLAIVLLVWWLWNSMRRRAEAKESAAAQPKVPESLGEAIAQASPAQPAPIDAPVAEEKPELAAPATESPSERPALPPARPEASADKPAPKQMGRVQEESVEAQKPQETVAPAMAQRSAPVVAAAAAAAVPAEEEPAAKPKRSRSSKKSGDDLTVVEGIGPKISGILHEAGIDSYATLAATSVDDLRKLLADNNLRFADPSTWPEQAALAGTDPGKLAELQSKLKRGRRQ